MNEATIIFNAEVTVVSKGQSELLPKEDIIKNVTEMIKENCGFDDVHIKDFKIFLTGVRND